MKAFKHHIARDFINDPTLLGPGNGAGKNGTVFLDYNYMVGFLKFDAWRWYYCEIEVEEHEIRRHSTNKFMATMKIPKQSIEGFKPLT